MNDQAGTLQAAPAPSILLVEDDALVRNHVAAQLQRLGYQVTALDCAPKALALLQDGCGFDLVVSDIRMPGELNGRDLARALRQLYPALPVLLTSGFPDNDGIPHELGHVGFLPKPYRRQELADKVGMMLGRGPGAAAA